MRRRLLDCNRVKRLPVKRARVPEPGPTKLVLLPLKILLKNVISVCPPKIECWLTFSVV